MQAAESAAPVQVFGEEALSHVGQPNLNQALTQMVPSFTAQTQGTDMSNFSLSARLRGLSPNHTLVMVNGKRRHGSAILQVIAGPFQGSAAPSIDLLAPDFYNPNFEHWCDLYTRGNNPLFIPEIRFEDGKTLARWVSQVKGFDLPVRLRLKGGEYQLIPVTTKWAPVKELAGATKENLEVDTFNYYIGVLVE